MNKECLYNKKIRLLENYISESSIESIDYNSNNGYYNNLLLDSMIIVKDLKNKQNSKYYISNTLYKEIIKDKLIYLIKIILTLYSTLEEIHFDHYIYYYESYDTTTDSYIINFIGDEENIDDILFNFQYHLL